MASESDRLQKVIASAGLASRRAAEALIQSGQVAVNGRVVTELGAKVGPSDRVEVNGKELVREPLTYILLYKPVSTVTTMRDPLGRKTVPDLLADVPVRVFPVGRLDFDTSGAILLTNDGELAHRLMHPRYGVQKVYEAVVAGDVAEKDLERLREGVPLDGRATAPASAAAIGRDGRTTRVRLSLHEGRNHQVRKMFEFIGHPVLRLTRTRYGELTLAGLRPGKWRFLSEDETLALKSRVGLGPPPSRKEGRRGDARAKKRRRGDPIIGRGAVDGVRNGTRTGRR